MGELRGRLDVVPGRLRRPRLRQPGVVGAARLVDGLPARMLVRRARYEADVEDVRKPPYELLRRY